VSVALRDRVVLLGDACHAVVPSTARGQRRFRGLRRPERGAREHGPDRDAAFAQYESLRKPHTDALADLSLANFVEMRDHAASRAFA